MFSFDLISIVLTIFCFLYMHQRCNSDSAVDTAWNFDDGTDLQGWADASAAEMQIAASLNSGEMQGIILGLTPNIASPLMSISVTPRHYIVIRMAYSGRNVLGELLISYGFLNEASQDYSSYRKFTWSDYSTPVAVSGSISSGSGADISATTDSDPSTYYLSAAPAGIFIVYDLGDYRWVTAVKITPLQGSDSPRRCILQRSTSFTDRGPFATVAAFTLNVTTSAGATSVQTITGLSAHARYWKLFIIDNDGGIGVGIRDVSFAGYKDSVDVVPFSLNNLGDYVTYYLPINHRNISTPIVRMRLDLFQNALHYTDSLLRLGSFQVDFVRIARAPEVYKVTGCLNLFYSNSSLINPSYSIRSVLQLINGNLPLRYYTQGSANNSSPYATTYNCPLNGGIKITIVGINFGESAKVLVGSNECPVIHRNSIAKDGIVMDTIICTLPATVSDALSAIVRVQNGVLPGLFYEYPGIAYGVNPQTPAPPIIVNVGSCRVDLIWHPPGNIFDALIVTGYKIAWSTSNSSSRGGTMTLGNVTTTSIRGLDPGTFYSFRIAAMSESLLPFNNAALPTDLYGRRSPSSDAAFSTYSLFPSSIKTLDQDFIFPFFNADHTLNHSIDGIPASSIAPATLGPTGQYGGEGQYGLALIGTANVQNCNASTTCCDGYNTTIGAASCTYHSLVNAVLLNRQFDKVFAVDGEISKQIPSNKLFEGGGLPSSSVFTNVAFSFVTGASLINAACGPAIRLTSSAAREAGAMWYSRKGKSFRL